MATTCTSYVHLTYTLFTPYYTLRTPYTHDHNSVIAGQTSITPLHPPLTRRKSVSSVLSADGAMAFPSDVRATALRYAPLRMLRKRMRSVQCTGRPPRRSVAWSSSCQMEVASCASSGSTSPSCRRHTVDVELPETALSGVRCTTRNPAQSENREERECVSVWSDSQRERE